MAYNQENGEHPENLQELSPKYLLNIPAQVVIPSEGWCYQGGGDYYRFGYAERDYFSTRAKVIIIGQTGYNQDQK